MSNYEIAKQFNTYKLSETLSTQTQTMLEVYVTDVQIEWSDRKERGWLKRCQKAKRQIRTDIQCRQSVTDDKYFL